MEAIILAGGLGTRLRSVVSDVPKPMADVNGKPFLAILIEYWIKQGITRFILSVGYKHEIIQNYFGDEYGGVPVAYSVEKEPLGTGGGLLLALDKLNSKGDCSPNVIPRPAIKSRGDGSRIHNERSVLAQEARLDSGFRRNDGRVVTSKDDYLILNGDTFFEINLQEFKSFHQNKNADLTMALKKVEKNSRYTAILVDSQKRIMSVSSKRIENCCLINGGIYLAKPTIFSSFKLFVGNKVSLENEIFPELLKEGATVYGAKFPGKFIDMGVPEDYIKMRKGKICG